MGLSKPANTGAPDESEHEPHEDAVAAALDTLYARAEELGLHYEPGFADDALAARVRDGQCDGLGTVIGRIPGRDGESGYYTCAGCKACDALWCEQCGADLSGEDNPEQHQCHAPAAGLMHHQGRPSEKPGRLAAPAAHDDAPLMTAAQRRLYRILASHPGRVFTTAELAQALNLTRDAVDALAQGLRHAIAEQTGVNALESPWGVAWRLNAAPPGPPSPAGTPSQTPSHPARPGQPGTHRGPTGRVDG